MELVNDNSAWRSEQAFVSLSVQGVTGISYSPENPGQRVGISWFRF
jgi:hypothetical protein